VSAPTQAAPPRSVASPDPVTPDTRPEIDRFVEALQPRLMGRRLSALLGSERRPCHVLDAKYEPGLRAVVLYGHGHDLIRGDLAGYGAGRGQRPAIAPGIEVSTFPDDPELPTLPLVMDAALLGRQLADTVPAVMLNHEAMARRCDVALLRYRPGKRATVLVSTGRRGPAWVAKVYHDPLKAAAVAGEAVALDAVTRNDGILRLAPTAAHVPELNLVLQHPVHGTSLEWLLAGDIGPGSAAGHAVRQAAIGLAELHRAPVVSGRERPVGKELRRFVARARGVATVDSGLGTQLLRLAERLIDIEAGLSPGEVGLVHGDCKPSQFLVDGSQVVLLDFDHCGVSDQAADVGTFVASLRQVAVRRALTRTAHRRELTRTARRSAPPGASDVTALGDLFVRTYLGGREDHGLPTRIQWYEVVALERKAIRAFARAPRSPLASALVGEGHRCLDRVERGVS
jgi:Phosphotransferase enzyme family